MGGVNGQMDEWEQRQGLPEPIATWAADGPIACADQSQLPLAHQ